MFESSLVQYCSDVSSKFSWTAIYGQRGYDAACLLHLDLVARTRRTLSLAHHWLSSQLCWRDVEHQQPCRLTLRLSGLHLLLFFYFKYYFVEIIAKSIGLEVTVYCWDWDRWSVRSVDRASDTRYSILEYRHSMNERVENSVDHSTRQGANDLRLLHRNRASCMRVFIASCCNVAIIVQ